MNRDFKRLLPLAVALLLMALPCRAGSGPLQYELRFEKPNTHLVDVSIHADGLNGRSVEFAIPDWAPDPTTS